jgi:hypothetical protein
MKRFFFLFVLLFGLQTFGQSKLGEVACVYVTSPDLDSSLAVYAKLGFKKIASNTFPIPWAQASDGSLLIMIRKDLTPYIGLTYYSNDVDKMAKDLEDGGIVFSQKPKEGDVIKRYYVKSPDDFNIVLSNNLGGFQAPIGKTMQSMIPTDFAIPDKYPNKQCGVFGEFCHPVTDLTKSIAFWEKLGFKASAKMNEPYPYAILSDGLMIIGLHQTSDFSFPAITYFGIGTAKRIEELKKQGLNFTDMAGPGNQSLTTFEGQHFFIFSLGM